MNKKVKNATPNTYNGIDFKSQLEKNCYKLLVASGFKPLYEPYKTTLQEKFKLNNNYLSVFVPIKKNMTQMTRPVMQITYTPDFYLEYGDFCIVLETKGLANDGYVLKRKMFFKIISEVAKRENKKFIFFEPHNMRDVRRTIEIIKTL